MKFIFAMNRKRQGGEISSPGFIIFFFHANLFLLKVNQVEIHLTHYTGLRPHAFLNGQLINYKGLKWPEKKPDEGVLSFH